MRRERQEEKSHRLLANKDAHHHSMASLFPIPRNRELHFLIKFSLVNELVRRAVPTE